MNKDLIPSLAWGGGLIAVALGAALMRQSGYIDAEATTRLVMGATGLMVAWYGNRMPKTFVPNARLRQANRVGGWSMAVSGLVYAGSWAFAPVPVAVAVGCAAVLAGVMVTLGYCLSLRTRTNAA